MYFEKSIRDGKVAVLYSPGYGAGWSTWASAEFQKFAVFDRRLVEMAERGDGVEEVNEFLASIVSSTGAAASFYTGGWKDIRIEWIDEGQMFRINEYDGSESIVFYEPEDYYTA